MVGDASTSALPGILFQLYRRLSNKEELRDTVAEYFNDFQLYRRLRGIYLALR